jgi:hypothetical protein
MPEDPTRNERQARFRAKQKERGLTEVRGIYAWPSQHKLIRAIAKKLEEGDEWAMWELLDMDN